MPPAQSPFRFRFAVLAVVCLCAIWMAIAYELGRSREVALHEAEIRTTSSAQIFVEYTESTIKRLNELLVDLRGGWTGNEKAFIEHIQRKSGIIDDIAFQVAIIDKNGMLIFSNLARPSNSVDLSDREHFKVHRDARMLDKLFISAPVKGKVSGKWSIQFTRPIFKAGQFNGVVVLSVSPDHFSRFATRLGIQPSGFIAMVKQTGELMARQPAPPSGYGQIIKGREYLNPQGPTRGNERHDSAIDGQSRIYGYAKLERHDLVAVVAESLPEIMSAYATYRRIVLGIGVVGSLLLLAMMYGLWRSMITLELTRRELQHSMEKAESANRAKGQFLAMMSHEIRTPMNAILGMTELLQDANLSPEKRQYADLIGQSAKSLLAILNDILDFSKVEAGKLDLEMIDFDLHNLVNELGMLYAHRAGEKSLSFSTAIDSAVPLRVHGDPTRLRQILNNLLSNALKFTDTGEIRLRVNALPSSDSKLNIHFEITDTGTGIEHEVQTRLFKPFTQADGSMTRRFGGTGLGLAICQQLTSLMNGKIGVRSISGEGTSFWVQLPFDAAASNQAVSTVTVEAQPSIVHDTPLLLVEDNPTNQMVAIGMLHRLGYRNIQVAANGQEAIERVVASKFDLIFMDCQMPVLDGFDATKQLRQQGCTIPIIAMTANAMHQDRQNCIDAGMSDYLAKPISGNALTTVLQKWLGALPVDMPLNTNEKRAALAPITTAAEQSSLVLDINEFMKRIGHDTDTFKVILQAARSDFQSRLQVLRKSLHEGDLPTAQGEAHSIKGISANTSAHEVHKISASLDMTLRANNAALALMQLPLLEDAIRRLRTEIDKHI
jgi:two-component system, sensor histidine kinase